MNSGATKTSQTSNGLIARRVLLTVYVIAIATLLFIYTPKGERIVIYGAGTRNTEFLPGEVLDPFILNMEGVQRPTTWEWGLFENRDSSRHKPIVHNLRFTYENEPTAFISPSTMVEFERLRRVYKWEPLTLSDVFEINGTGDRFTFKVFPKSNGRSGPPLY